LVAELLIFLKNNENYGHLNNEYQERYEDINDKAVFFGKNKGGYFFATQGVLIFDINCQKVNFYAILTI